MAYLHETTRADYQDLASGMVLHSAPGFPAFPVRLAGEMFQRALALRGNAREDRPVVLWDPCCGSGYLLTVLAILHRSRIAAVLASDIGEDATRIAARNLALLTRAGLSERAADLRERAERFDKPSYAAAAEAAGRIGRELAGEGGDVPHRVHRADVLDPGELRAVIGERPPDIVVTDVPYGEQTAWLGPHGADGVPGMVRSLAAVLPADAVIALAARGRKVPLGALRPAASFRIGTRAVALIVPGRL
ncbi:hypothetical protein GCM10010517_05370 [Streptosporangium fragile]|uniref:rRNA methyltransferase n=1 Tax=Streptosporangium fragile TaxID=46186 RepID=A0ABP6I8M7_9ACTN